MFTLFSYGFHMVNTSALQKLAPSLDALSGLRRDFDFLRMAMRMQKLTGSISEADEELVADDFETVAEKYAQNVAFYFEGGETTYAELDARANRVARWALDQGLRAGDCVALIMENRPDYLAVWIGLAKVGVVTALVSNSLEGRALAHCVNISGATHVITGSDQDKAIEGAKAQFEASPRLWTLGGTQGEDLDAALAGQNDARLCRAHRAHLRCGDLCLYAYTSGTTGLPKAARLSNARVKMMMRTFIAPNRTTERDRVYVTLPLYHATGGIAAVGQALMSGAGVILRRRFSASAFWDDVAEHGATSFVYIGELCRYLLNQPPHPEERTHQLRNCFGNGLRPEIWDEFRDRFAIPQICEFYSSTEGNVSILSFDGKVGAVGRIPHWLEWAFAHVAFVKFDVETEQPVRGADGFVVRADVDEPGEVLGRIGDNVRTRFDGYNDEIATSRKILRDVFEPGDMWFRTGDLMRKDAQGYVYFVDRIGDTYRWKGENVSTNEVGKVLSRVKGVSLANVYGVPVPGADGKAGMAAVTLKEEVDFNRLYDTLAEDLPPYAIPLFIRVQQSAETTGTFKFRKVDLVKEGFNPNRTDDPVWMLHPEQKEYVPLTEGRYKSLIQGAYRF